MKRVFYGICNSGAAETNKQVVVSDTDLLEQNFDFDEGDLLVVFFASENTEDSPSLVIYVNDTENETSVTIDEGKYVKTHDVTADVAAAWGAGETVIFAYTRSGNTNTYYWELIDAVHASSELYGVTKLFDDTISESDFSQWINEAATEEDSNIALTPNALKHFFNLLKGAQEGSGEEDPEAEPLIGLTWTPSPSISQYETDDLGTLSITGDSDGIIITYPIQALIDSKVGTIPTHTGQLINNGNGPNGGPATGESDPFITKNVPDDLFFANGNGLQYNNSSTSIPRIILNNQLNEIVIGMSNDNTLAGIHVGKPLVVDGNTTVSSGGITVTGNSAITGNLTISGDGYANVLYENGTSLRNKYSPIIEVYAVSDPSNKTIGAKANISHQPITMTKTGYTFLGVAGYNLDYAETNTGDATWCNVWECYKYDANTVWYGIRNLRDSQVKVHMTVWGIYKKNI